MLVLVSVECNSQGQGSRVWGVRAERDNYHHTCRQKANERVVEHADELQHLYRLPPERRSVGLARKQPLPIYVFHGFKLPSNWANDVFIIAVIVPVIYYYLF